MNTRTKTKAHTQYHLEDGTLVPGVTTILGVLAKPALIHWSWECGMKGEDYRKVRDSAGDIGTLTHYLILCHLKGEAPDTSEYSAQAIAQAEACLRKFYEWITQRPIQAVVIAETPLASNQWKFGGTPDCLVQIDGQNVLIDIKTGKAIYEEAHIQTTAYYELLRENGYQVDRVKILRIGRSEEEGFEERNVTKLDRNWQIFRACLTICKLRAELKAELNERARS